MRIKIVSDGTLPGSRVTDENGNEIENVRSVVWSISAERGVSVAAIHFDKVEVELESEAAV